MPDETHLLVIGEPAPAAFFTDIEARTSSMYKAAAKRRLGVGNRAAEPLDFAQVCRSLDDDNSTHYVDCEARSMTLCSRTDPEAADRKIHRHPAPLTPFCFCPKTSRNFPTACSSVSVRSRCRRPLAYWQTPED